MSVVIKSLAENWGLNFEILNEFVEAYDSRESEKIPCMEDLIKLLDHENALCKAPSILAHNMALKNNIPKEIRQIKEKYM
jgi:hypothetical protein